MLKTKIIFFILLVMMLNVKVLFAHPPSKIDLSYDHEQSNLHIVIMHTTKDLKDHFIRKVVIIKNEEKPIVLRFARQSTHKEAIEDITLEAETDDVITVKAFCSIGGSREGELVVPEEEEEGEEEKEE